MIIPPEFVANSSHIFDLCYLNHEQRCVQHPRLGLPDKVFAAYVLMHVLTGMYYIGSGGNVRVRLSEHRSDLTHMKHKVKRLQACYEESFHIQVQLFYTTDRVKAFAMEQILIDLNYEDPLNLNTNKNVLSSLGMHHSKETKAKIGASNKGKKHTEESKLKVSIGNAGKKRTPEAIERLRLLNTGRKHTPENIEKMRLRAIGNKHSLGYKHTEEAKRNISQKQIGKVISDETKRRWKVSFNKLRATGYVDKRSIPVMVQGVQYTSATAAAKKLNLRPGTVWYRIQSKALQFKDWYEIK